MVIKLKLCVFASLREIKIINFQRVLLLLAFLSIMIGISGYTQQPAFDFKTVEKVTYELLLNKKWDSLIETGRNALKNKQDYFYLRLRLGIAYYETGNYRKAAQNFEKAVQFNGRDTTALEYLYYSYLFTNRNPEAKALTLGFPLHLNEKLKTTKLKLIEQVYTETGPTFSNNIKKNEKKNLLGQDTIYGMQDLNDDKYYLHFGLGLNVSKRVSVYLGYTNLKISKLKQIQTSDIVVAGYETIPWDGGYTIHTLYKKETDLYCNKYDLFQNEIYMNSKITAGKGFIITPAFHGLMVNYNTLFTDVAFERFYPQMYDTTSATKAIYTVQEKDTSYNNYVASLSVNKNISLFNIGLFTSYSNLNNKEQYQLGGSFTWLPQGNLNYYTTSVFTSAWEESDNRLVFDQLIGTKLFSRLWFEGFITFGEIINYNEKNAFIIHNSGDKVNFRMGANLIIPVTNKIEISLRYSFLEEEGYRIRYTGEDSYKIINSKYQNNTIIGGIKWKL